MEQEANYYGWDSFDSVVVGQLAEGDPRAVDRSSDGGLKCPLRGHDHFLAWRDGDYKKGTEPCGEPAITFRVTPTFIYEDKLNNFIAGRSLVKKSNSWGKAETHRLGYEPSEDALTWNVFRSLQQAVRLGLAAAVLAGVESRVEPTLYLWGGEIGDGGAVPWSRLQALRDEIEPRKGQQTEPDVALFFEDWGWVLIEAKFGSPMTTYAKSPERVQEWVKRYARFGPDLAAAQLEAIAGRDFPEQALRNVVFMSQLSQQDGVNGVVIALVREKDRDAAERLVQPCLGAMMGSSFKAASWEQLAGALPPDDPELDPLRVYLERKSFGLRRAFNLGDPAQAR